MCALAMPLPSVSGTPRWARRWSGALMVVVRVWYGSVGSREARVPVTMVLLLAVVWVVLVVVVAVMLVMMVLLVAVVLVVLVRSRQQRGQAR